MVAHGIAEGQYFIEGNKRVALAAMVVFLQINGYDLTAAQAERAEWIIALSAGLSSGWLAERIRKARDPELESPPTPNRAADPGRLARSSRSPNSDTHHATAAPAAT